MSKENPKAAVFTPDAPAPIGPYSQAIRSRDLLFCSGQVALDPKSGQMVGGEDVQAQAKQVMANIAAVLTAAGTGFDAIVKTTIFLKSMSDFPKVNETYGTYFKGTPPARSTVAVAGLPKDALVEIEVTARI